MDRITRAVRTGLSRMNSNTLGGVVQHVEEVNDGWRSHRRISVNHGLGTDMLLMVPPQHRLAGQLRPRAADRGITLSERRSIPAE